MISAVKLVLRTIICYVVA